MIKRIPGWLNFVLLFVFYVLFFYGFLSFIFWAVKLFMIFFRRFGQVGLFVSCIVIVMMCLIYAGGYLAKFREKQGGGWRFW